MKNRTVAIHTLGCKLNFAESSTLMRELAVAGFTSVRFEEPADVYVINTCSVTENADRECRKIVHKVLRQNPDAFVAVTGCYAQLKPEEIASMEGVDLVLGASEKFRLPEFLSNLAKKELAEVHSCEIEQAVFFTASYSAGDRTRSFLKVQDGCNYTCSYCTIPMARGISRSDSMENISRQAREIAGQGVKEIVLTGVNIGDYKSPVPDRQGAVDSPGEPGRLLDLLRSLDDVDGIERFRISSIEPNLLSDDIIRFVAASRKFVPHFHIPLQSGCDKILKLMRRRYLRDLYVHRVRKIKSLLPEAAIGADVIVGFPGESEDDFLETYRFIQDLDVSYLHVFTYSERSHTDALTLKEVVPVAERKRRNKMLRILSDKKHRAFCEEQSGKPAVVLFEGDNKDGFMHGYTPNYIKVKTPFDPSLVNRLVNVRLTGLSPEGAMTCAPEVPSRNSAKYLEESPAA